MRLMLYLAICSKGKRRYQLKHPSEEFFVTGGAILFCSQSKGTRMRRYGEGIKKGQQQLLKMLLRWVLSSIGSDTMDYINHLLLSDRCENGLQNPSVVFLWTRLSIGCSPTDYP